MHGLARMMLDPMRPWLLDARMEDAVWISDALRGNWIADSGRLCHHRNLRTQEGLKQCRLSRYFTCCAHP